NVQRHRVTSTGMAPTMIAMLMEDPRADAYDLSSLKRIGYGAAAMPAEVLKRAWAKWPQVGFTTGFGMTELAGNVMGLSSGEHVYPREVEEVLYEHPAVAEAAVVGAPDPTWGESVVAVIRLRDGEAAEEEEIIAFCRARIASYKKPRRVVFVPELPKNASGK